MGDQDPAINRKEDSPIGLTLANQELQIISRALFATTNEISEAEFQTRLGYYRSEAQTLRAAIDKVSKDNEIEHRIDFSKDELLLIGNALNEVLHGINLKDFEAVIWAGERDVYRLLEVVRAAAKTSGR